MAQQRRPESASHSIVGSMLWSVMVGVDAHLRQICQLPPHQQHQGTRKGGLGGQSSTADWRPVEGGWRTPVGLAHVNCTGGAPTATLCCSCNSQPRGPSGRSLGSTVVSGSVPRRRWRPKIKMPGPVNCNSGIQSCLVHHPSPDPFGRPEASHAGLSDKYTTRCLMFSLANVALCLYLPNSPTWATFPRSNHVRFL